jgi:hypothetical protein
MPCNFLQQQRTGEAVAAAVSRSCACIGSPCLRHCVHGASIGGGGDCSWQARWITSAFGTFPARLAFCINRHPLFRALLNLILSGLAFGGSKDNKYADPFRGGALLPAPVGLAQPCAKRPSWLRLRDTWPTGKKPPPPGIPRGGGMCLLMLSPARHVPSPCKQSKACAVSVWH